MRMWLGSKTTSKSTSLATMTRKTTQVLMIARNHYGEDERDETQTIMF